MRTFRLVVAAWMALSLGACVPNARAAELTPADESDGDMKSGSTAFVLSFLGTAVPVVMGVAGSSATSDDAASGLLVLSAYMVGPSLGHFYAGRPGRAFLGIGVRTLALVGAGAAVATSWDNPNSGSDALAIASLLVGGGSAIVDIAGASGSARAHNEKMRKDRLSLTPALIGPTRAPGLRADWSF